MLTVAVLLHFPESRKRSCRTFPNGTNINFSIAIGDFSTFSGTREADITTSLIIVFCGFSSTVILLDNERISTV